MSSKPGINFKSEIHRLTWLGGRIAQVITGVSSAIDRAEASPRYTEKLNRLSDKLNDAEDEYNALMVWLESKR